jgi:Family of unknown function (DUF6998)
MMGDAMKWDEAATYLDELYTASEGLERLFPGRKFTLDGHLVGSIGEVAAAYMFDLELNAASTQGHDAISKDGRQVEIKLTQGKGVAIRHEPEHLLVLHRPKGGPMRVVYNGPGSLAWHAAGKMQKNGQRPIGLTKLAALMIEVASSAQLPMVNQPPV